MKKRIFMIVALVVAFVAGFSAISVQAELVAPLADGAKRMEWWTESRFGMFIHFGLYALPARHEWVQRLEHIEPQEYAERYFSRFDPDLADPHAWVRAAKAAGMKYVVLTTKHHEGFCLWDSRFTDYKITNTPFGRDIVREFTDACRVENIRVGFYYSLLDWHHPDYPIDLNHPLRPKNGEELDAVSCAAELAKRNAGRDVGKYQQYMKDQITELLTNYGKVDILFYDFSSTESNYNGSAVWDSKALLALTRRLQPEIIVNDRLGLTDVAGGWDFLTPEQIVVDKWPERGGRRVAWETCQTFSGSWGYYRDEETWKSPVQLIDLLVDTCSKGGNLLLNVGPTARGRIDSRACECLTAMGDWMQVNGRSVYGCTAAPAEFVAPRGTKLTWNPSTRRLYVHVLEYPIKVLPIAFGDRVTYAQFLHDASEVQIKHPTTVGGEAREDVKHALMLPVKKPPVAVPVIEVWVKN